MDEVSIPESLRPNFAAFYFKLDPDLHVLAFESYSESKGLSARSVEKYFKEALRKPRIVKKFGRVEADVVKSYGEVERIIQLEHLKELKLTIRRPNTDGVYGDLASEIEERLAEQNGEEYQEITRSKDEDGLSPNDRTKKLAIVAAENGEVSGKSIVNGVLVSHTTQQKPEKVVDTYNRDEVGTRNKFLQLARKILTVVRKRRSDLRDPT